MCYSATVRRMTSKYLILSTTSCLWCSAALRADGQILSLDLQERVSMKQRSPTTGTVHGAILVSQQDGNVVTIAVDSSAWFAWLERAASFRFRDEEGHLARIKLTLATSAGAPTGFPL